MSHTTNLDDSLLYLWHAAIAKQGRDALENRCWSWMNEQEKRRAESFKIASSQNQYIVGKGMTRWLLSEHKDRTQEIEFATTDFGKPYVEQPISAKRPFNLSHTDGLAVCLIGSNEHHCIGVDVERFDRNTSPDLADRYFAPPEIELLNRVTDPDEKKLLFLKIWTLKEAFIKAIGTGLRTPLCDFFFDDVNSTNPRIKFLQPNLDQNLLWSFHCFEPRSGFVVSTAVGCSKKLDDLDFKIQSFESEISEG